MRFSNERRSPAKKIIRNGLVTECRDYINYKVKTEKTYMHYNNAIYMGDMISYKRNGVGVMLADQGTSAIVEYCYDSPAGHSVFLKDNAISSVVYIKKGNFEVVLRIQHYICKIPFYDQQKCEKLPNGSGLLIDFQEMKVFHLVFQGGRLMKKIMETNKDILSEVAQFSLKDVMNIKHEKALKLNLEFDNGLKILKKKGKAVIGFFDIHHNLEGVGFKLNIDENNYDKFDQNLQLKCIERGFYAKNRLQNFGERYFPNGNLYIGEFQDDSFNGRGLLLYPSETEGKWVFGDFQSNKLVKMIEMSLGDPQSQGSSKSVKSVLKSIHQFNTRNWMNVKIELIDWDLMFSICQEAIELNVTDVVLQKEKQERDQEERLYKIQKHFSDETPSNEINKLLLAQRDINSLTPEKLMISQYCTIKGKELQIEPRSIENEQVWSKINTCKHKQTDEYSTQRRLNRMLTGSLEKTEPSISNVETVFTPKNVSPFKFFKGERRGFKSKNLYDSYQY